MSLGAKKIDMDKLAANYSGKRVWGVVSRGSTDKFHIGLTLSEAQILSRQEVDRGPGRSATIVLTVKTIKGAPL
jgi:hypothetical protein